ncbi:ImmA/IrrE family metallo-endopeptidase [Herminiimonas sp. NPDC097707]|uniref:ImmA/IrrE family metallo-endopeptidase n=1 Tax=Herminiimonas sp. NPDC097707 TaxID=3364007 RepID=UPI00383B5CCB
MSIDPEEMSPAERLLWSYGVTSPSHIDLIGIANDRNATVVYRPLCGCEARLVACGDSAVISVSESSLEGRQRFSLAHELAHWICDKNAGSFQCAKEDIGPQNAGAKTTESQANGYASQLILPTYLVDPWIKTKAVSLDTASALAKEFSSSLTAAAIKLIKRSDKAAVLACHSKIGMAWHQRSASFPYDFYVNQNLHHDTEAFTMAFTGKNGMTRIKKEPANYWLGGSGVYRVTVETQSVRLPDGNILSMILVSK